MFILREYQRAYAIYGLDLNSEEAQSLAIRKTGAWAKPVVSDGGIRMLKQDAAALFEIVKAHGVHNVWLKVPPRTTAQKRCA